ncbi:MAG: ankyrin repeat domain-containing protein [Francisellaceae bacterium]|nr:ankyrin repeat domain-containing protein [Francisellaceae bacterium]
MRYDNVFYLANSDLVSVLTDNFETLDDVLTRIKLDKKVGCKNIYSAKINGKERLIFTITNGKLVLLGEMDNHKYDRLHVMGKGNNALLREMCRDDAPIVKVNVERDEDGNLAPLVLESVTHAQEPVLRCIQGNLLTLNNEQNKILEKSGQSHKLIIGGPGSGKTITICQILMDKLNEGDTDLLYISKEGRLVDEVRAGFVDNPSVRCLTWHDFVGLDKGVPKVAYPKFHTWVQEKTSGKGNLSTSIQETLGFWKKAVGIKKKAKVNDIDRERFSSNLYEEMRIITGYTSDEYITLGEREKLFWHGDKKVHQDVAGRLLTIFNIYNEELKACGNIDLSLYIPTVEALNSALAKSQGLVFDEIHDIPRGPLKRLFETVNTRNASYEHDFCEMTVCFDNQQSMIDTVTSLPYIERNLGKFETHYLNASYRCDGDILTWSNNIISMKNSVAGGIDGKDDYSALITSMTGVSSRVSAIETTNHAEIDKLNELLQRTDISTVVIVPSHTLIDQARVLFPGASIYTVEESKGLEFDVVVKYGFYNSDDALLKEVDGVYRNGGYSNSPQNRSKERNSLSRSNSLYFHKSFVAATRTMSELIVVDDVMASDSFPYLWAELKGDISIFYEVPSSEQNAIDFSQLSANEQINTLSGKISEFYKSIHDDMARGITRNIDALKRNMDALIQQREFIVEQAVDTSDTETLWSIIGLSETLNSDMMRRIAANPNANIEMLEQILGHINDVSVFEQLLAREDILNTDEIRVEFMTSVLKCMIKLQGELSTEELSSFDHIIERTKKALNSLHHNLISNSTLTSNGIIDYALLRMSTNDFTSTITLNILMGQCLYHGHIDVVIDICNHKNADSDITQMAAGYLQRAETISFPLAKAVMLSTHTREAIITDIIANEAIDLEFKQATIQQSRFRANSNIIVALVSAKKNKAVKNNDIVVSMNAAAGYKGKKGSERDVCNVQVKQDAAALAKQEKNEKLISGHAGKVIEHLRSEGNNFTLAHKHLMRPGMPQFSDRIITKVVGKSSALSIYFSLNLSGLKALNNLLSKNNILAKSFLFNQELKQLLANTPSTLTIAISNKLSVSSEIMLNSIDEFNSDIINHVDDSKYNHLTSLNASIFYQPNLSIKLIKYGAKLALCANGDTPLHYATQQGLLDVVEVILNTEAGIKTINLFDIDMIAPLHLAAKHGFNDIAYLLIEYGAQLHIHNKHMTTPLVLASATGNFILAEYILSETFDCNIKILNMTDDNNLTALDYAIAGENEDFAIKLIMHEAKLGFCDNKELGTHLLSASKRMLLRLVEVILNKLHDTNTATSGIINQNDNTGLTPLHFLIFFDNEKLALKLINLSPNLNINTKLDEIGPPLLEACSRNMIRVVDAILDTESGLASIDLSSCEGYCTPLHMAAEKGSIEITRSLINHGAFLYPRSIQNETPLILAVRNNHLDLAKLILEHTDRSHIDTNSNIHMIFALDDRKNTVLDYAEKINDLELISLIERFIYHTPTEQPLTITNEPLDPDGLPPGFIYSRP